MDMLIAVLLAAQCGAVSPPEPLLPVPSPQQLAWQNLEYGMFCHFGINTFHNEEWTDGTKDPKTFLPAEFNGAQWVAVAKEVGMKYLVVTAKHHDGFATYPTKFSEYAVTASPWRDGKGDVVREVADACHAQEIMFGFYLSPWDRHEPGYSTPAAYDVHFKDMLREIITAYGPVGEVWFDGAGSEGHVYDWPGYYALIRELAPEALIAICGPDIRWVGNEDGVAPDTLWNTIEQDGKTVWKPAECDVPIRHGQWFFHTDSEKKVKPIKHLLDIYYRSVGHGAVLLLNVSPDRRGLLPDADVARLRELKRVLDETFKTNLAQDKPATASATRGNDPAFGPEGALDGRPETYWTTDDGVTEGWLEVDFGAPVAFDRVVLQEHIPLGQRIENHVIEAWDGKTWQIVAEGTTIGYKRIHRVPETTAAKMRVRIIKALACPTIQTLGVYKASPRDVAVKAK